jgi:hypothetical protein
MSNLPWNERAVLTRESTTGGDRQILMEGQLGTIVDRVTDLPLKIRPELLVSMPDRKTAPLGFSKGALKDLVFARFRQR